MQTMVQPGNLELSPLTFQQLLGIGPVMILTLAVLVLIVADVIVRGVNRGKRGIGILPSTVIVLIGAAAAAVDAAYLWFAMEARDAASAASLFIAQGPPKPAAIDNTPVWTGTAIYVDHFALFVSIAVCFVLAFVALTMLPHLQRSRIFHAEVFPLLLTSAIGMMLLGMSRDLLITFISIEMLSIPLYVLCGMDDRRPSSRESALKYFLLGAFASGFFIYGSALIYGTAGHLNYSAITYYLQNNAQLSGFMLGGVAMVGVGLCFKLALAPFHAWVPDVYQGAPTPITGFMAVGVKLGVFAAAMRFIMEGLYQIDGAYWRSALAFFAVISMVVGNLFALHQMSAKRLLAYSAIAHTGYIAVGLCTGDPSVAPQILIYLIGYGLAALGAFGLISYLAPRDQDDIYLDEMHELSKRAPVTSLAFAVLMLSMAGFPLTAGFIGKLVVFAAAWKSGLYGLVIFAVLNSVIGVYYYLRFVLAMYMQPKAPGAAEIQPGRIAAPYVISGLVVTVMTLLLGVLPGILFDWVHNCGIGL